MEVFHYSRGQIEIPTEILYSSPHDRDATHSKVDELNSLLLSLSSGGVTQQSHIPTSLHDFVTNPSSPSDLDATRSLPSNGTIDTDGPNTPKPRNDQLLDSPILLSLEDQPKENETLVFNFFTIPEFVFICLSGISFLISSYYTIYFACIATQKHSFGLILSYLALIISILEVVRAADLHARIHIMSWSVNTILADNATALLSVAACYSLHKFMHAAVLAVTRVGVYAPKLKLKQQRISKLFMVINVLLFLLINAAAAALLFHPRMWLRSVTYWTLFAYFLIIFVCLQVALSSLTTALTRCITILTAPPSAGAYAAHIRQMQEQERGQNSEKDVFMGFPNKETYLPGAGLPSDRFGSLHPTSWPATTHDSNSYLSSGPLRTSAQPSPSASATLPGSALSVASLHSSIYSVADSASSTASAQSIVPPRIISHPAPLAYAAAAPVSPPHSLVYNNSDMFQRGLPSDSTPRIADHRHTHAAAPLLPTASQPHASPSVMHISAPMKPVDARVAALPAPLQPSTSGLGRSMSGLSRSPSTLKTSVYKFMLSLLAGEELADDAFAESFPEYSPTHRHSRSETRHADIRNADIPDVKMKLLPTETNFITLKPTNVNADVNTVSTSFGKNYFPASDRLPSVLDSGAEDLQSPLLSDPSASADVDPHTLDMMFDRALANITVKAVSVASLSDSELTGPSTLGSLGRRNTDTAHLEKIASVDSTRPSTASRGSPAHSLLASAPSTPTDRMDTHNAIDSVSSQATASTPMPARHLAAGATVSLPYSRSGGQHTLPLLTTEKSSVPPTPSIVLTSSLLPTGNITLSYVPGQPASLVSSSSLSHSPTQSVAQSVAHSAAQSSTSPSDSFIVSAVPSTPTLPRAGATGPSQLTASLAAVSATPAAVTVPGNNVAVTYSAPVTPVQVTIQTTDGAIPTQQLYVMQTTWPSFGSNEPLHVSTEKAIYTINSPVADRSTSFTLHERETLENQQFLILFQATISKLRMLNWTTSFLLVVAMAFLMTTAIMNVDDFSTYAPVGVWWRDDLMSYVQIAALTMIFGILRHIWVVSRCMHDPVGS